ncbi:MAG TPA: hypothetical protein VEO54_23310 [Thermoanaerobaculia bacterium]|nr:hypothetical protein [Thermoanaerobaculia bacterium]
MTRAQKLLFAIFTLAIAATRIPALSLTLHDWDETLFAHAVREYDVKPHHPHPPGYPLFIALAKLARLVADTEFHALQTVATIAAMLLFPAAFFFARELRFPVSYAFAAAATTAFIPTIWYYGGTGLSDVPALLFILVACALLLRGARDPRAYVAGALFTAAACSIRPHLLMIAVIPALLGAWANVGRASARLPGEGRAEARPAFVILGAWLAAAGFVAIAYVAAAYASSNPPHGYVKELRYIRKHIANTDSFRNPHRTPLPQLAERVFLFPFGGGRMKVAVVVFAAIALVDAVIRRRKNVAILVAMFLPMAVFTWLMLDMTALARYAIAYVTLHAFLAVAGIEALARLLPRRAALPVFFVLTAAMTSQLIKWTWPALRFARTEPSPVVAAFEWIRANVPRHGPRVFVHLPLVYHAQYLIPDYPFQLITDEKSLPDADYMPGNVFVFEGEKSEHNEVRWFKRKRLQLWEITRPRFFELGIVPMHKILRWERGWYLLEGEGNHTWRWMQRESLTRLSPAVYGAGVLHMRLHAPVDVTRKLPVVTVFWNGEVIDRVQTPPSGDLDLRYTLLSRHEWPNDLRIVTDQWIVPKDDGRELGLSLKSMTWTEPSSR